MSPPHAPALPSFDAQAPSHFAATARFVELTLRNEYDSTICVSLQNPAKERDAGVVALVLCNVGLASGPAGVFFVPYALPAGATKEYRFETRGLFRPYMFSGRAFAPFDQHFSKFISATVFQFANESELRSFYESLPYEQHWQDQQVRADFQPLCDAQPGTDWLLQQANITRSERNLRFVYYWRPGAEGMPSFDAAQVDHSHCAAFPTQKQAKGQAQPQDLRALSVRIVPPAPPVINGKQRSDWAREALLRAGQARLIPAALSCRDYRAPVTREDFAALLLCLIEKSLGHSLPALPCSFTDTASDAVCKLLAAGLVQGLSETEFGSAQPLTREQLAVLLQRALRYLEQEQGLTSKPPQEGSLAAFADATSVSPWARAALSELVARGILRGNEKGALAPQESCSTEQAIALLLRVYEGQTQ